MKRSVADITFNLLKNLWEAFLVRVPYAGIYQNLVWERGGSVIPDHIGFRTLNTHTGEQPEGIWAIRHIIERLGYQLEEQYSFPRKKLKACYFSSKIKGLPKIFVSQLEVLELPEWAQQLFPETVSDTAYLLSDAGIELLAKLKHDGLLTSEAADVLEKELAGYFCRPWKPPFKETILKLNDVSHYAAWTLLHGNSPSHFAALETDLESACSILNKYGIPLMPVIYGKEGSVLQQTATLAVKEDLLVQGFDGPEEITWTYAYFELLQRGMIEENGQPQLFQGFLENHERQLYRMTRILEN